MKTDAKISSFAIAAFFGTFVALTVSAQAQTNSVKVDFAADPVAASTSATSGTVSTQPSSGSVASATTVSVSAPQVTAPKPAQDVIEKKASVSALEEEEDETAGTLPKNIPQSVKGVVTRLNKATKDVTIEDLNAAREAIVKLDVLIDIEKRLNDLSTLRQEREEKDEGAALGAQGSDGIMVGGRLPSSAAMMPPPALAGLQSSSAPSPVMPIIEKDIEVKKVVGASGRYMATIMDVDGSEKRVHAGDKLSNGGVISAISKSGVTVTSPSKKQNTIQVKDIGAVFGG